MRNKVSSMESPRRGAKQQAKTATATSTELTTFTQLLADLVDPEILGPPARECMAYWVS